MAKIETFEDIEAWKAAREVARQAYDISHSGNFARDFALQDQVHRAAISTMANIAEGFDSGSNREFLKFLSYALRSATELQSHLYIALDQGYVDEQRFNNLFELITKCKGLISGFSRYLRSHPRQSNFER